MRSDESQGRSAKPKEVQVPGCSKMGKKDTELLWGRCMWMYVDLALAKIKMQEFPPFIKFPPMSGESQGRSARPKEVQVPGCSKMRKKIQSYSWVDVC